MEDLFGTELPGGALARCGTVTLRHQALSWFGFAPDAAAVASTGGDGALRIWDCATGRERIVLRGHAGHIHDAAYFPDGLRILSGGADHTARIFRVADGAIERTIELGGPVTGVAVSPLGQRLAIGTSNHQTDRITVEVFSEQGRSSLLETAGLGSWQLAFSPDGQLLIGLNTDGHSREQVSVWVWEVLSGALRHQATAGSLHGHGTLRFVEAGTLAAHPWPSSDAPRNGLSLVDLASFEVRSSLSASDAARDGEGRLWLLDGRALHIHGAKYDDAELEAPGSAGERSRLEISPRGELLAMQREADNLVLYSLPELQQHPACFPRSRVEAVSFSIDGSRVLALANQDPRLFVFAAATGQQLGGVRLDPYGEARGRCLGGDGGVEWTVESALRRFSSESVEREASPEEPLEEPSALALSPDGRLLVGHVGNVLHAWDAEVLTPHTRAITMPLRDCQLAVSNHGHALLAGVHEKRAQLLRWDPRGGELSEIPLEERDEWTPRVAAAADARVVAWSDRSSVYVCDLGRDTTARLKDAGSSINQIALSPDGSVLAVGRLDGTITLQRVDGSTLRLLAPGHASAVTALAFSTDGKRLASGSQDTSVLVWSVAFTV
jgi:WD40 repeat protein